MIMKLILVKVEHKLLDSLLVTEEMEVIQEKIVQVVAVDGMVVMVVDIIHLVAVDLDMSTHQVLLQIIQVDVY